MLSFSALSTLSFADLDANSLEIGVKEPINVPISGYDDELNSYPDPFSEDQIILTIDKYNYLKYTDNILTPGQIEMFNTYPDSFKMHVYPSRRSCSVPQEVIKLTRENAKLTDNGEGIEGGSREYSFSTANRGTSPPLESYIKIQRSRYIWFIAILYCEPRWIENLWRR